MLATSVLLLSKAASAMIEIPIHRRTLSTDADRDELIKRAPRTFPKLRAPRTMVADVETVSGSGAPMAYDLTNV